MPQDLTWKGLILKANSKQPVKSNQPLIRAAEMLARGELFAMVTVVRASGSTPRKEGARMWVNPAGVVVGSVGGGSMERLAVEKAKETLLTDRTERLELSLDDAEGEQTDMVCGGVVELLIEPFGAGPVIHLFGAGHVAQPTAKLALDVGYRVCVYDSRPEWSTAERFPGADVRIGSLDELAEQLETTDRDFLLVMTHSHAEDYTVLRRLLRKPFYYLGVIGSARKAAGIRKRLAGDGFSDEEIARMTSPIGIDIGSHTPAEIAISVAAQLVMLRKKWEKERKDE